jgi:hypothetical protein
VKTLPTSAVPEIDGAVPSFGGPLVVVVVPVVAVVAVVVSWVAAEPLVAAVAAKTPAAATPASAGHRQRGRKVSLIVQASSCLGPSDLDLRPRA